MPLNLNLSIVIPAYNEAQRLPETLQTLADQIIDGSLKPIAIREVLVVDDGSRDETAACAEKFAAKLPGLKVLKSPRNFGKGHAVRQGLLSATQPWVLVADADMSTPWPEVLSLAKACESGSVPIAIGSRDVEGSNITRHQSIVRESLGRSFNFFVRTLTRLPFKDTQCGFKLFRREPLAPVLKHLEVDRFAWDVELLMFARHRGLAIVEVPVAWAHKENSRVSIFKDGMGMLGSVLRVRFRLATKLAQLSEKHG